MIALYKMLVYFFSILHQFSAFEESAINAFIQVVLLKMFNGSCYLVIIDYILN